MAPMMIEAISDLNVIVPNTCEQGHDQCDQAVAVRQYDNFLARIVPKIERERTVMPRTTPSVRTTRNPSSVNAVVTM